MSFAALPDALLSLPSTQDVDYKDTESPGDWGTLVIFATLCQEFLLSKHSKLDGKGGSVS